MVGNRIFSDHIEKADQGETRSDERQSKDDKGEGMDVVTRAKKKR